MKKYQHYMDALGEIYILRTETMTIVATYK